MNLNSLLAGAFGSERSLLTRLTLTMRDKISRLNRILRSGNTINAER